MRRIVEHTERCERIDCIDREFLREWWHDHSRLDTFSMQRHTVIDKQGNKSECPSRVQREPDYIMYEKMLESTDYQQHCHLNERSSSNDNGTTTRIHAGQS